MLLDAIQRYHDLLTDELAAESQAQLDDQLRRRNLFFGDRALCTVVRPRFLLDEQYRWLQERAALILRAFGRAHRAALAEPGVRAQFGLLDWEEELVLDDPGFTAASPTSRLDAFFVDGGRGLRFTEYNAETPAGAGYNDALTETFFGLPVMREFLRTHDVRSLPVRHSVMHCLLDAYAQWAGRREIPRVAILDWREVPTYSEFVIFDEYFRSQGLECVIADPREVEYTNGRLMAGDRHITLIYKRVLISELVERGGLDHPVIRAVRDRAVCMVNPFACKILHKKTSLAVLTDERNEALFDAAELAAIAQHIPWTRRVEERRTRFAGRDVDLLPFIAEHREHLVLKPNDEYGGKGIVLGWEVSQGEWEAAIATALAELYIVQDRIVLPTEPYPSVVDGRVVVADRMLDTAPYAFYGAYMDGCLSRIGTTSLLNVTAGGGSNIPTLLVRPR
ncbi:MAG: hypothetical protein WKG32_08985 [Gemmatimonadaceae bacterium]